MTWEQSKQAADQLWRQLKDTYGIETAEMVVKALFRQVRPKTKPKNEELAECITENLFTDGLGNKGQRLAIELPGQSIGGAGWCRLAVKEQVQNILNQK